MDDKLMIGGKEMPVLDENGFTVTKEKIWNKKTGRSATGKMIGDVIATKHKVSCKWGALDREDVAKIDQAITPAWIDVTFTDPGTDKTVTKEMYAGTPTYPVFRYERGVKTYKGVTVNLIER